MTTGFPFSAVVGQDDVKLALLLAAVDPALSGVLLRGEKGSAKTTLARGLAAVLPGQAPFVELPVGATEDRLIGTLDLVAALTAGQRRFQPGLLAAAHGGVLYVDEVNLLPDHLVDVLLDVAASGVNRVEREGVSHAHPSRFVLIGSMNPEEGDLRPQLLDRFGLAVDVVAPGEPRLRAEAVMRRLAFDADPDAFGARWAAEQATLASQLAGASRAPLPAPLVERVSGVCAAVGAQGLRADLTICRAAAALAGFEGRPEATEDDVRRVAPLALGHRRRLGPFDSPGISPEELQQALQQQDPGTAAHEPEPDSGGRDVDDGSTPSARGTVDRDTVAPPAEPTPVVRLAGRPSPVALHAPASGRRSSVEGSRGRLVGDRSPDGPVSSLAVGATVREAVIRRGAPAPGGPGGAVDAVPLVAASDLRQAVRQQRAGNLIVIAVDASGSMGTEKRMEAAKGAVVSLLLDAYQRRDQVALVTFRGDDATVVLKPTSSVEVARARMAGLPTGGRTPLAAGIRTALEVASRALGTSRQPLLILITDGRATTAEAGGDAVGAAQVAAAAVRRQRVSAVVVDAEDGPTRLGLAREVAEAMGARYLTLGELSANALTGR